MTPRRRLVLASASAARLRQLRMAGLDPEVAVSGVSEEGYDHLPPAELVTRVAEAKATAVAQRLGDALVLAADSMFEIGGETQGKPRSADDAAARWRRMRGHEGVLHTGHCVIDTVRGVSASAAASTIVRFAMVTEAEIAAYVASGEPLGVAGAFTLDGRSAPFVEAVEGDPGTVIGLSLPLVRRLFADVGVKLIELWVDAPGLSAPAARPDGSAGSGAYHGSTPAPS